MLQRLERKISLLFCLFVCLFVVFYLFIYLFCHPHFSFSSFYLFIFCHLHFCISISSFLSAFLHPHPPSAGIRSASYRHPKTRSLWSLFCELGISLQDQFCLEIEVYLWKKRKTNIFENCNCQQVNMAKNTADEQRSPRS